MAGTTIVLFPRRVFDYSTNVAINQSIETTLIKALDASQYTEGTLIVRVHLGTSVTGSAKLDVLLKTTAPTPEDPTNDFIVGTAVATASVTSTVSTNKPTIVIAQLSAGFAGRLQVSVKAIQDPSTPQTIKGDLSAILVLKAEGG